MSSPVLLRLFLASILINSDIAVKEGQLFCDAVCEKGILYDSQRQRLQQCERLLVAIELACWLNDASLVLQTVVQIYGLLAPMLYHKIPSTSAVQVLISSKFIYVKQMLYPVLHSHIVGCWAMSVVCIWVNSARRLQ